jgi:hypothetical protein
LVLVPFDRSAIGSSSMARQDVVAGTGPQLESYWSPVRDFLQAFLAALFEAR